MTSSDRFFLATAKKLRDHMAWSTPDRDMRMTNLSPAEFALLVLLLDHSIALVRRRNRRSKP